MATTADEVQAKLSLAKSRLDEISQVTANVERLLCQLRQEEKTLLRLIADSDTAVAPQASSSAPPGILESISSRQQKDALLSVPTLLKLKKFDTPTISNGIELITQDRDYGLKGFNLEHVLDHMPDWNTLVGYAITVKIQPGNRPVVNAKAANRKAFGDFVTEVAAKIPVDLPKIIVVEDLDVKQGLKEHGRPYCYGSMWGEVNANFFHKLGVKGVLVDGAVRDIPEMKAAGMRAMSRTLTPSHSYGGVPLEWDTAVEVFGTTVWPGDLIAMDRHGFQVIPRELEGRMLDAAEHGDLWERDFTIAASWGAAGTSYQEVNRRMGDARGSFGKAKNDAFGNFDERMGKDWDKEAPPRRVQRSAPSN